jgi:hypothetical protein
MPQVLESGSTGLRSAFTILLLGSLSGCGTIYKSPADAPQRACTVTESSRIKLIDVETGNDVYIEPHAISVDTARNVLLAGRFNVAISPNPDSTDLILGAIIGHDETSRLVYSPVPSRRIGATRLRALAERSWLILFTELEQTADGRRSQHSSRVWYGIHDGSRWISLDTLPFPPATEIGYGGNSSTLLQHGDTLIWAVPARTRTGSGIAIFHHSDGEWTSAMALPTSPAAIELLPTDSSELLLATVQGDPRTWSDGNSLLLWKQGPSWNVIDRLVHGTVEGRVHKPHFNMVDGNVQVTWHTFVRDDRQPRAEVRTMANVLDQSARRWHVVDPQAWRFVALPPRTGEPWWITSHEPNPDGPSELHFRRFLPDGTVEAHRFPMPFFSGIFTGAWSSDREIITTGPVYEAADGGHIYSLLVRYEVRCSVR